MKPAEQSYLARPDLGAIVSEVQTNAPTMGFIASRVYPYFHVAAQSADYPVLPAKAAFNVHETRRASGGKYQRVSEEFEFGHYKTTENGLEYPMDDRFSNMYGGLFPYETSVSTLLMGKILRAREARVASKVFNTKNYASSDAPKPWVEDKTADIRKDVNDRREALRRRGIVANLLIVNWSVFLGMCQNTAVIEAVRDIFPDAAKSGTVNLRHLETYLDMNIAVAGALQNTAKKSKAPDLVDIWSDDFAMVARVAESADSDILEPCIGRTICWNEGAAEDVIVEEYREDSSRSAILRVRDDSAEHMLSSRDEDDELLSAISRGCGELIKIASKA